jgi:uroporphyrinogen-III synthase
MTSIDEADTAVTPTSGPPPLSGFTVAVTAARRADELVTLLNRRGAATLRAPALRIVPLADDGELLAASKEVISRPPDIVVATTGIGFRGWLDAADAWGLTEPLLAALRGARLLARGPKARGALRAAGLAEVWSPPSESSAEVLEYLLEQDVAGLRIAVQLHGEPLPDLCTELRRAGVDLVTVPVYRWVAPADTGPLDRLIEAVTAGSVDAVTFTSAPAVASMLARAELIGRQFALEAALRGSTVPMCVGPVCAGPLLARGIPAVWPRRARMGALVRRLAEYLPASAPTLPVGGHLVELRGHAVILDGAVRPVPPASMAILRLLARQPGRVVDRSTLLAGLPSAGGDEHAVEMAVARLRVALGKPDLVRTVVKRGYRLPVDAGDCDGGDDMAESSRVCGQRI